MMSPTRLDDFATIGCLPKTRDDPDRVAAYLRRAKT